MKTTQPIFTKFDGKVTHGLRKKPLNLEVTRTTLGGGPSDSSRYWVCFMLNSSNNLIGISGHDRSMLSAECHSDCLFYGLHEQFSFWSFVIEFAFWSSSTVRSKPSAATCQLDNNSFIHSFIVYYANWQPHTNIQIMAVTQSTASPTSCTPWLIPPGTEPRTAFVTRNSQDACMQAGEQHANISCYVSRCLTQSTHSVTVITPAAKSHSVFASKQ